MPFLYQNITISGGVAVGKNTLFDNLKPYLEPKGFTFRTTGQILRDYTQENVMPVASLVEDDFHRHIEKKTESLLKNEKQWVIEGWLAGFVAREIKSVLKVLLICSSHDILVDRVVNRDKVAVQKAESLITKRENENFNTWKKIYGDFNFFDPDIYDLVVDTRESGPLETVGKVLDCLGYKMQQ